MNWGNYQQYPYGNNGDTNYSSSNPAHHQQQQTSYPNSPSVNPLHQQQSYLNHQQNQPPSYPFSQQVNPDRSSYPGYGGANTTIMSHVQHRPLHSNISLYPTVGGTQQNTNHPYHNLEYNQIQYHNPPPPPPPPPRTIEKKKIGQDTGSASSSQPYSCEECSISFPTVAALNAHTKSHIKCKKCSFTASKKVVSAHYKSVHGEFAGRGLKTITIQYPGSRQAQRFKICVGNHPDDIKAWIEERKKRFPTRAKLQKQEEKNKRNREEGALGCESSAKRSRKTVESSVSSDNPISSISTLIAGYGSSSSDEEDEAKNKVSETGEKACTQITNELPEHNPTSPGQPISKFKTKQCRFFLRNGSCKNGDSCTYIHDIAQHEAYKNNALERKQKQSQRDRARNEAKREMNLLSTGRDQAESSRGGARGGQTLLRKLLQNDIRRERSLCLQLLRYIVDCNFLQEQKESKA